MSAARGGKSDLLGRSVGLGEPRVMLSVLARCYQWLTGDGGWRGLNADIQNPHFFTRRSALAGERLIGAERVSELRLYKTLIKGFFGYIFILGI